MTASLDAGPRRLFYALWPDEATSQRLAQVQALAPGRAVHRDDFHITLAFLGEQPAGVLPLLEQILGNLPQAAMTLVLDRVAYFRRHRIAALQMSEPPAALLDLQAALAAELLRCRIGFDQRRRFQPHITLARNADAPADTVLMPPIVWQAGQVALVQSAAPTAAGAKYRLLATH
jgi:2'-5' RNA ligase